MSRNIKSNYLIHYFLLNKKFNQFYTVGPVTRVNRRVLLSLTNNDNGTNSLTSLENVYSVTKPESSHLLLILHEDAGCGEERIYSLLFLHLGIVVVVVVTHKKFVAWTAEWKPQDPRTPFPPLPH